MLGRLHLLKDYHYYFQFTLMPYSKNIEANHPPKSEIIETFQRHSDQFGKKRMIRQSLLLIGEASEFFPE